MKRTSQRLLLSLLQVTGKPKSEHYRSLDPFAPAVFPVAWTGETESLNWMHIAREENTQRSLFTNNTFVMQ